MIANNQNKDQSKYSAQQKYLDAYNKLYGSSGADDYGNMLDYTAHENYGKLGESDKSSLQNWYDTALQEQSINKQKVENTLQATKTNDLYMKYLNQLNVQNGLSGQGIADTSLNRLQNNYMSALGKINSETSDSLQENYMNAFNAQRENEEFYANKEETDAANKKAEINEAVDLLFNSQATKTQALEQLKKTYGEDTEEYNIAMKRFNSYANWAAESNEYDDKGNPTNAPNAEKWYDVHKNAEPGALISRIDGDVRPSDQYYTGQQVKDLDGNAWKISQIITNDNAKNYGYKNGDEAIKGLTKMRDLGWTWEDGKISKGANGTYYAPIGGYGAWVLLEPVD